MVPSGLVRTNKKYYARMGQEYNGIGSFPNGLARKHNKYKARMGKED
jgi:hypothetical protein